MDKKRIVIVGLNFGRCMVFSEFVHGKAGEYFELAGLCDLDADKCRNMAANLGVRAYANLAEVLADPEVAVVGLFTGPWGRAGLISQIIRAGKDVMTTKPFELDPQAAMDVLLEARRLGRVVHLNSPGPQPSEDLRQIARWREQYNLGRPVAARADAWVSYREQPDGSWYDDPARCPAAPVFRIGIYMINDLVGVMGQAKSVQVTSSRIFTARPTADNAQVTIQFADGAIASVFASFCVDDQEPYKNALVLNFERGTIYRNSGPSEGQPAFCRMELVTPDGQQKVIQRTTTTSYSGLYQWDVLHRAISGEKIENEVPPEQIVQAVRIVRAIATAEQSAKTELV